MIIWSIIHVLMLKQQCEKSERAKLTPRNKITFYFFFINIYLYYRHETSEYYFITVDESTII